MFEYVFVKKHDRSFLKNLEFIAPASKSMSIRAVFAALLSSGTSVINDVSSCDDSYTSMAIVEKLGANVRTISSGANKLNIAIAGTNGRILPISPIIDCNESGLCARMLVSLVGLNQSSVNSIQIIGRGSLLKRPFEMVEQLSQFGISVTTTNGRLPVIVSGKLKPAKGTVDASLTSQVVSGLLMSLPLLEGDSELMLVNPTSKPYIAMTLDTLEKHGVQIDYDVQFQKFFVHGYQKYKHRNYQIEGDWSAAAFLLVLGILSGKNFTVKNLYPRSKQADRLILDILMDIGVKIDISQSENKIMIHEADNLKPFKVDVQDCPDLVPAVMCLAAFCEGKSMITNVERLKFKESDRVNAMLDLFSKVGIQASYEAGTLFVTGKRKRKIKPAKVNSYMDHRIAMAAAILGTQSDEGIVIQGASCVRKSFPDFYEMIGDLCTLKGGSSIDELFR